MADLGMLVTAAMLRRGRDLERLSRPITLAALLLSPLLAVLERGTILVAVCISVSLLGLLAHYWAVRVALDADLFEKLARMAEHTAPEVLAQELERALVALGLAKTAYLRDWPERQRAALGLLRKQALCLLAQWLLALVIPASFLIPT